MVKHTPLRRNPRLYEDFYYNQGGNGLPVFIGGRQRGHGIGSFLSGLGRMALPWLKMGGKALLREGVGTGLQVAQDALAGKNIGDSFKQHAREAGGRLLQGAVDHIVAGNNQSGNGIRNRKRRFAAPPGESFRTKKIKSSSNVRRRHNLHTRRKKHSDIFD